MSLTPGARLGPYEIVAPIGAGGMGEVYRASDSHLKRSVAIKVLTFRAAVARNAGLTSFVWGLSWFPSGDRILATSGDVGAFRLATLSVDDASPATEAGSTLIATDRFRWLSVAR